jgi:hypothetical protein
MKLHLHIHGIRYLTGCILLACCLQLSAQTDATQLAERFRSYSSKALQEKLYMHVDRNYYLAGDILWFSIYVTDGMLHQPLDMSKVAYVEILDEHNAAALQAKISLAKGRGNGSFSLPVSLTSGNYKIRAYTNWMKNAGADYFFEKEITIVNTQKSRELPAASAEKNTEPDIRFFPEGGNLVTGIASRIACKATGTDGKGIAYEGHIVDENNNSIAAFQSFRMGMGSFYFTPLPGHTYRAVINASGKTFTRTIPRSFEKGYVMHLEAKENAPVQVSVQTNLSDTGKLFLLVHTRQSLKTIQQAELQQGKAVFSIDPSRTGEGITHFTVFTSAGRPVCERLYFTFPSQKLSIHVSGQMPYYETRSAVELGVETSVSAVKEKDAALSVSVYRLDEPEQIADENIETYFWLSSDLKGRIESPAYYFNSERKDAITAIDNLMLTQGWRRFAWEDVLQQKTPAMLFPPEMNGHIITGKVVSSITGKPLENIETYIAVPGLNANLRTYISDTAGHLKFDFKQLKGNSEVIVQTNPAAYDTLSRVDISNPFADQFSAKPLSPFHLSAGLQNTLLDRSVNVQVQRLYAGLQLKRFIQSSDTTVMFEKPDAVYMMDDYTRFGTIEEVLREYVTLMDVQKRKSGFSIYLWNNYFSPRIDMANHQFFQTDPLILVDGVPIFNTDRLMGYDPLKMRKLEVYNKRFFLGNSFFSGILNWTSYKGDLANFELDPHALVVDYEGLQLEREFYSPVYDAANKEEASHTPDYRTLLYWSPNVESDTNGAKHIRFFTSDKKGRYATVIQGLNANGQCGSTVEIFEVK